MNILIESVKTGMHSSFKVQVISVCSFICRRMCVFNWKS